MKALTALIVAHTGHLPKAKNNKEGSLKTEAAACIANPVVIRTPPPSPERAPGEIGPTIEDADSDSEGWAGAEADGSHVQAIDFDSSPW